MKTMVERNEVLHRYRVQQQSKRQISRDLSMSRHTVDKIVCEYERECLDTEGNCDMGALERLEGRKPAFRTPARPYRVVSGPMLELLRQCLEQNKVRRATGQRKLQWNCRNMHSLLLSKGYSVSYPSVCVHVRRLKAGAQADAAMHKEVYIHREHAPGQECEFDCGEVVLTIGGGKARYYLAVFTLVHSGYRSAWLFRRQDTLALMEAHRNFFRQIGGVPHTMVYDNMKTAVTVRREGRGKAARKYPTQTMRRLSLHYCFEERFCNAASGWEKGSVERSVEVIRREAFVSRESFDSIETAQAWLGQALDRLNGKSGITGVDDREKARRIYDDLHSLKPVPQPIGCFEAVEHRPGKYCTVTVDSNNYSVPEAYIDKCVTTKIYSDRLVMFCDGRRIATHRCLEGKGHWSMQLEHYLATFLRKPGALDRSTALRQVPKPIAELYRVHFAADRQKEFISLMMYARDNGILHSEIAACAARLRARGIRHMTADHIKVDIDSRRGNADCSAMTSLNPDGEYCQQQRLIEECAGGTLEILSEALLQTRKSGRTNHQK